MERENIRANKYLKNSILEVVDDQLKMNEPACTRQTFDRLIELGSNEKEAKEKISAVLLEEMYYILKYKKKLDEQKYADKLNSLISNNDIL